MTVKVFKEVTLLGQTVNAPQYLPEGVLTRDVREKADILDSKIQKEASQINESFKKLHKGKIEEIEKWRWLGGQIDTLMREINEIEQKDVDNNTIWLAVGQYLSEDLKRNEDTKRSGTAKDHLRKCWLLFKSKNTRWIKNWAGWDALVDRGEQLVLDNRLLGALEEVFLKDKNRLSSRDYQFIFKRVAEKIPSNRGKKELDLMKSTELKKMATEVEKEWADSQKSGS